MATIRKYEGKRGTKYTAQIRFKGHTEHKSFTRKSDAAAWAKRRETELREAPHLPSPSKDTVADVLNRYERDILPTAGKSIRQDRPRYLAWWRRHYGTLPIAALGTREIAEARDRLLRTPKERGTGTLSAATVGQYLLTISHVLSVARGEWHLIDDNPALAVRKPKLNNERTRALSDDELRRLMDACRDSESSYLMEAVTLALTTGARQQEVMGLTWQDLDFAAKTVTFRQTKTKEVRTVALADVAAGLLHPRRGVGLVFPAPPDPKRPDRPPVPVDLRSAWETALRRAGVEDFRWHDLRHSAASILASGGASLLEVGAVLGHKTASSTKRYSHMTKERVAQASARLGEHLTKVAG
jgi:integrase